MMRRAVLDYYTDPALEADDDGQESEPLVLPEPLVISHGVVTWHATTDDDND